MKTLINICFGRSHPIGRGAPPGEASERLVRIAYGCESFTGRAGLYCVVRTGMSVNSQDIVGFTPLIKNGKHIEGGLFSFRGLSFLLFLEREGPPVPLDGTRFEGEDLEFASLNFHNQKISQMAGKFVSQVLTMHWPPVGAQSNVQVP